MTKEIENEMWKIMNIDEDIFDADRTLMLLTSILYPDILEEFDKEDYVLFLSGLDQKALSRIESRKMINNEHMRNKNINISIQKGYIKRKVDIEDIRSIYKIFLPHNYLQNMSDCEKFKIIGQDYMIIKFLYDEGVLSSFPIDKNYDEYKRSSSINRPYFKCGKNEENK